MRLANRFFRGRIDCTKTVVSGASDWKQFQDFFISTENIRVAAVLEPRQVIGPDQQAYRGWLPGGDISQTLQHAVGGVGVDPPVFNRQIRE